MVKKSELALLPEKSPYKKKLVNGVMELSIREIGASVLNDDDVIAFIDLDGRRMFIGHDKEGAYKYPV